MMGRKSCAPLAPRALRMAVSFDRLLARTHHAAQVKADDQQDDTHCGQQKPQTPHQKSR
jgi:hypothetical protein